MSTKDLVLKRRIIQLHPTSTEWYNYPEDTIKKYFEKTKYFRNKLATIQWTEGTSDDQKFDVYGSED